MALPLSAFSCLLVLGLGSLAFLRVCRTWMRTSLAAVLSRCLSAGSVDWIMSLTGILRGMRAIEVHAFGEYLGFHRGETALAEVHNRVALRRFGVW